MERRPPPKDERRVALPVFLTNRLHAALRKSDGPPFVPDREPQKDPGGQVQCVCRVSHSATCCWHQTVTDHQILQNLRQLPAGVAPKWTIWKQFSLIRIRRRFLVFRPWPGQKKFLRLLLRWIRQNAPTKIRLQGYSHSACSKFPCSKRRVKLSSQDVADKIKAYSGQENCQARE